MFTESNRDEAPPVHALRPRTRPIAIDRRTGRPVWSLATWFEERLRLPDTVRDDRHRPARPASR